MSLVKAVFKQTMLPGIIPRIARLFREGFSLTAYLIANIFNNARLIPPGHPYLNPYNRGRFGIRHVLGAAAANLVFSRRNIDQIVIYFTVLTGIILLLIQIALFIAAIIFTQPALAGGGVIGLPDHEWTQLFINPSPPFGSLGTEHDLAFILLDQVFGVPDLFESCVEMNVACYPNQPIAGAFPWPFHVALHRLMGFYSNGLFIIGGFIILYFITTIVLETADKGRPFGQRFNRAWVPVRLIFFMALLMPLTTNDRAPGLNLAQLGTLLVAKYGSNFATNAWSLFITGGAQGAHASSGLANSYLTQNRNLVAQPNVTAKSIMPLLQIMHTASTCRANYNLNGGDILAYVVRQGLPQNVNAPGGTIGENAMEFLATDFETARAFSMNGSITVAFGVFGENQGNTGAPAEKYRAYKGHVYPYCGAVNLPVTSVDSQPGAEVVQQQYYEIVQQLWQDPQMIEVTKCIVQKTTQSGQMDGAGANCAENDDKTYAEEQITNNVDAINQAIQDGFAEQEAAGDFDVPPDVIEGGWVHGATIYNWVAEMNGAVTAAVHNVPKAESLPILMEKAQKDNKASQNDMGKPSQFKQASLDLENSKSGALSQLSDKEREMVVSMREAFDFWENNTNGAFQSTDTMPSGNMVIDMINNIFGTEGLYDMKNNTDVHPLAQLSALGKGIIEASIRNAVYAIALASGGSVVSNVAELSWIGDIAKSLSGMLFSVVMASLSIGVVLYYVLPFMPFIYFFFAVSGWLKSIFEAMVAVPLWALAHLRIDGEGLPGPGATQGYYLLLEIFLRPVLIVFGLIASISIFSAVVNVMNQVFDVVVANVGGFQGERAGANAGLPSPTALNENVLNFKQGPLDEFFFTVIYAILCYMIGLGCFKLVDQVPNNVLRWMGVSVPTFQEQAGDPAGKLASDVYRETQLHSNAIMRTSGDLPLLLQK
jgi:conjugal transfer/type IV secretion protein DotA/TraY